MDAFFVKIAIFYNPSNIVEKNPKTIPYYGGHIVFYVTALNGERIPATGIQLSNPGRSLELPYCFMGLGRTNNFIENLRITLSLESGIRSNDWTPIVPNSQLIIVPGDTWLLKTYISPT